jgi:membrane associated rhomboid family serine protease
VDVSSLTENDAWAPSTLRRPYTLLLELAALAAVPLLLVLVYSLPVAMRRSLVFEYGDPTVLTAIAAPFVHIDPSHLLVNLVGYAIVLPVVYALSVLTNQRRRFWIVFVTFVVVFPPILSYLNLAIPRPSAAVGFSGVVLAFVGYLPIVIADYLEEELDVGPREMVAPMTFFLGLALIAVLSVQSVVPSNATVLLGISGLVVATLLCALLFWIATIEDGRFRPQANLRAGVPGYLELLAVAVVLFVGIQFVAFPGDPTVSGGVVNLYIHLLGYALGFISVYSTLQVDARFPGHPVSG